MNITVAITTIAQNNIYPSWKLAFAGGDCHLINYQQSWLMWDNVLDGMIRLMKSIENAISTTIGSCSREQSRWMLVYYSNYCPPQ